MRIKSVLQKGMAVVLTMSLALGVTSVATKNADAKAKSAKIPVTAIYCFCGGEGDGHWLENATVNYTASPKGKDIKKSAKVAALKTVTFKSGKKQHITLTLPNKTQYSSNKTSCLLVDTFEILKTFKKVTYSNVSVKCNGKSVKAKYQQGYFETKLGTQSHRLVFYNEWGDDTTKEKKFSQKYPLKKGKSVVISFDIVAK